MNWKNKPSPEVAAVTAINAILLRLPRAKVIVVLRFIIKCFDLTLDDLV